MKTTSYLARTIRPVALYFAAPVLRPSTAAACPPALLPCMASSAACGTQSPPQPQHRGHAGSIQPLPSLLLPPLPPRMAAAVSAASPSSPPCLHRGFASSSSSLSSGAAHNPSATDPLSRLDRIHLKGARFYGFHGALREVGVTRGGRGAWARGSVASIAPCEVGDRCLGGKGGVGRNAWGRQWADDYR